MTRKEARKKQKKRGKGKKEYIRYDMMYIYMCVCGTQRYKIDRVYCCAVHITNSSTAVVVLPAPGPIFSAMFFMDAPSQQEKTQRLPVSAETGVTFGVRTSGPELAVLGNLKKLDYRCH